jgi:ATPase subunit of ABC transporter with duplicated ATPase domains
VKKLEKIERVEPPRQRQTLEFEFAPAPRSGDDVVRIAGLAKAYGERRVFDGLDLAIRRRERWCVMGANGAGKSTLLKLVAGEAQPDAGSVTLGAAVRLGYFAQHAMELLDGDETVWGTLEQAFPNASVGSLRTLAGCFGFPGDDVEKRCRLLSGGERARLVLARMLYDPPNFLVLDEPTNHLDLATKEMLIRALARYEGTLLLVSHDRRFLSALTNRVLELEAGAPPRVYGGGYTEYVAASGHEAPGMRS